MNALHSKACALVPNTNRLKKQFSTRGICNVRHEMIHRTVSLEQKLRVTSLVGNHYYDDYYV